jgi:hypothetical protein
VGWKSIKWFGKIEISPTFPNHLIDFPDILFIFAYGKHKKEHGKKTHAKIGEMAYRWRTYASLVVWSTSGG